MLGGNGGEGLALSDAVLDSGSRCGLGSLCGGSGVALGSSSAVLGGRDCSPVGGAIPDVRFKRGIDADDLFLKAAIGGLVGGPDLRIAERDFTDLLIFLFPAAGSVGEGGG